MWDYYELHGRHGLPWRQPEDGGGYDPYKILVSEIMLQQTQVSRVIPKYLAFIAKFPTVRDLASAELGQVLRVWSGLGYNRRAKYLWQAARLLVERPFPDSITELVKLPGVGKNTAGAILAYTYNRPVVFIETNIRTVYIHHFFADRSGITDEEISQLLALTLDTENPRQFYWGLMDYGTNIKAEIGNLNKLSKYYVRQSAFHGSKRQLRGAVLRSLGEKEMTMHELRSRIDDERLPVVLSELTDEDLIKVSGSRYRL